MTKPWRPQNREWRSPLGEPPWRMIEMKIGKELRERYQVPQGLPQGLLTLVMQFIDQSDHVTQPWRGTHTRRTISDHSEGGDRSGYA